MPYVATIRFMPRRKTTVYLDEPILRAVKRVAKENGASEALIIREAVASYVRSTPKELPRFVGMWTGGPANVAERTDELLAQGFGGTSGSPRRHKRPRRTPTRG